MPASRSRRFFCQALLEETGGEVLRWATIADVAKRFGMDEREAILLADECAEADYVRLDVKGPPYRILPGSAILTEAGRQLNRCMSPYWLGVAMLRHPPGWPTTGGCGSGIDTTPRSKPRASAPGATRARKRRR
jgi:hypothetical protein